MIAYSKLILRETEISSLRCVSVSCYLPFEIFISLCDYIFPHFIKVKIFILLLGAFYSQNVFKLECLINFNIKFKIKEYELSKSDTSFIGVIGYAFA